MCLYIISSIFLTFLPIFQLYYAIRYSDDVACNSSIHVGIINWLIVQATTSILLAFVITKHTFSKEIYSKIIYGLFNIFQLVWLVVGSIIFWKDCPDVTPNAINNLMWASLIIGFFTYLNHSVQHHVDCNPTGCCKAKKKESLLDVV